jgi:hypothetical protein
LETAANARVLDEYNGGTVTFSETHRLIMKIAILLFNLRI